MIFRRWVSPGFSGGMRVQSTAIFAAPLLLAALGATLSGAPLRVGVEPQAEQLSHLDAEGRPVGFAVDLARAVAREQALEIEFVIKPWTELLDDFRAHRLDLLAAVGATPERDKYLTYTSPLVELKSTLFVRPGFTVPAAGDQLNEVLFGTTAQSLSHDYLVRRGWTKVR